ncbi:hypothetical protein CGCFRS4_v002674 [Colletotrichum fructicola]|nr:hypothetical protein CGCFRS4_v002674 [Colletotrichum fructicola]
MSDFLSSTEFDKFLAELDSNAYAIDMGFMDLLDPIGYDDGHVGDGGLGPAAPLDPVSVCRYNNNPTTNANIGTRWNWFRYLFRALLVTSNP